MCGLLPKAPKVKPPAAQAPPAAQGADGLMLGADNNDDRQTGQLGRLSLRVGSAGGATGHGPGATSGAPATGGSGGGDAPTGKRHVGPITGPLAAIARIARLTHGG